MEILRKAIESSVKELFDASLVVELTRPEEQFGDFTTNVALQLAQKLGQNPREVAEKIVQQLKHETVAEAAVAGPGFVNITLSDSALKELMRTPPARSLAGQTVVAEYSDPNPFKVLHAGHLYTSVVGDAIANLLEAAGANVHRVNFGGDVGLHVGKAMWGVLRALGGEHPEKLDGVAEKERSNWMAAAYVAGNSAYEDNEQAKAEIVELNKRVYKLHEDSDHESPFAQLYWTLREWSYNYFNTFYKRIGSSFEKYYPESETAPIGMQAVREQLARGVYEQSDGAVIFNGEKYGLHTRVFINSEGLPTYETKDVGLLLAKWRDFHPDMSVIITGNDIAEYMKVVLTSVAQFMPEATSTTRHLTHGNVKLTGGVKMSSRKGNILRAEDVLDAAQVAARAATGSDQPELVLGAVKYAFLKQRIGGDIIYDPQESVSLEGHSGPYLQYAHARACSILAKAGVSQDQQLELSNVEPSERSLVRKLGEFAEVVEQATTELMPHQIATYMYELSQVFNRFYEKNRVIGEQREAQRLAMVQAYQQTLARCLGLLGMAAPERL